MGAGFGIFSQSLPVVAVAVLACTSLALTGLIPGSIFAAAPQLAPQAAVLAIAFGLINQASNIGSLAGPATLGAFAQALGWSRAPAVLLGVAIAGVSAALLLRHVLRKGVST